MTLEQFMALLLTADPKAKHYGTKQTGNYTVWQEYNQVPHTADDRISSSAVYVQVDRYTKIEFDPMVQTITDALDGGGVSVIDIRTLYEIETGYIHHIWDLVLPI